MSLTLVEAAKLALDEGEQKRAGVIAMFARESQWLASLPFMNIPGNAYAYNQEGTLPAVAFRGINEAYTESTGVINPAVEALRIAGGDLDVDTAEIQMFGNEIRTTHESMKIKALAASISTNLIKGDSTSDPRQFDGLQNRITGNQLIEAGNTDGGDALSLAKLDEAIDACTNPSAIWMSKAMRRRLTTAQRTTSLGGYIQFSKNEFGQPILMYNELPILVAYPNNGGTEPLAFNEVGAGGATATATSIYVLGLGDGLVTGIQNGGMQVRDLGEVQTQPVKRTRVEWLNGLAILHGRAAVRLRGIKDGAVVA